MEGRVRVMRMRYAKLYLGLVIISLLMSTLCQRVDAAPITTFEYTASGNGGTVSGLFGWDHAVSNTGNSNMGSFSGAGFLSGSILGGTQGGGSFSFIGQNVDTMDLISPWDQLQLYGGAAHLTLRDPSATALTSAALPTSLIPIEWPVAQVY